MSVRPDPTAEVNNTISEFKTSFSEYKDSDNELLSFAENFAINYFTYAEKSENDYIERLGNYAADKILKTNFSFSRTSSEVLYARAYRKEEYSQNQSDVWVLLHVRYTFKETSSEGVTMEKTIVERTIVKVPVFWKGGRYIVEDFPVFVNDSIKAYDYKIEPFAGSEVPQEKTEKIKVSLQNFFKAYTVEAQGVINYFLSPDAQQEDFVGLNGRLEYQKIESIKVYALGENTNRYLAVVVVVMKIRTALACNKAIICKLFTKIASIILKQWTLELIIST